MNSNKSKTSCKRGFTLIELLVVVLIIGILAAVALPQYKKAVMKSKVITFRPILSTLRAAEEAYYLANGEYTDDFTALDVSVPCEVSTRDKSLASCGEDWVVDLLGEKGTLSGSLLVADYCPKAAMDAVACASGTNRELYLQAWLAHSSFPLVNRCSASTDIGKTVCRSIE